MYNAISLTNKNETKCGLQNKNYAKCLFIFVDQNEMKRNVITLFRLALSRYYYYFAVFLFPVSLFRGSGLPGFRNKTRPIATQN